MVKQKNQYMNKSKIGSRVYSLETILLIELSLIDLNYFVINSLAVRPTVPGLSPPYNQESGPLQHCFKRTRNRRLKPKQLGATAKNAELVENSG